MNGVPLGDVDLEMHVVFGEAEFAELKAKTFQVPERLDTGIDVALFTEISVSFMCRKHHRHPVIAGVTRNLFRATAICIFQNFFTFLSHLLRVHPSGVPRATRTKKYVVF